MTINATASISTYDRESNRSPLAPTFGISQSGGFRGRWALAVYHAGFVWPVSPAWAARSQHRPFSHFRMFRAKCLPCLPP